MPAAVLDVCRKEIAHIEEWSSSKTRSSDDAKSELEAMWNRSSGLAGRKDPKLSNRWALRVRAQYEPTRRATRFFQWHHNRRSTHTAEDDAAKSFYTEAARWKRETMHWSSITRMLAHPSYLRIIGLGRELKHREIEALILKELRSEPDHWFEALAAITGENPVKPEDDFDDAVNAWLNWGRQKGIIRD